MTESTASVVWCSGLEERRRVHRVLVVNNEVEARDRVRLALQQVGVEAMVAPNGAQALEWLQAWARAGVLTRWISMVISAADMPAMDGYMLTAGIRRDPLLCGLYVLLQSSPGDEYAGVLAERAGADGLLVGFRADEVAGEVCHYLMRADRQALSA